MRRTLLSLALVVVFMILAQLLTLHFRGDQALVERVTALILHPEGATDRTDEPLVGFVYTRTQLEEGLGRQGAAEFARVLRVTLANVWEWHDVPSDLGLLGDWCSWPVKDGRVSY